MATHTQQEAKATAYFITFTCFKWMHLIEKAQAYAAFYKWFDYLSSIQAKLLGYVIMPNHFHGIIYLDENCTKSINTIVANAKRFIAYYIVNAFEESKQEEILRELFHSTSEKEKKKGQKHKVFQSSFDAKEILGSDILMVKLDYIHRNPCQGKWMLAVDYTAFEHSSASYYELAKPNKWITDYRAIFF